MNNYQRIEQTFNLEHWSNASTYDRARGLAAFVRTTPAVLAMLDMVFAIVYPFQDSDRPEDREADWTKLRSLIVSRDENSDWHRQAEPMFFRAQSDLWGLVARTATDHDEEDRMPPTMPEDIAQAELLMETIAMACDFNQFRDL
jgi:hypothetical protein